MNKDILLLLGIMSLPGNNNNDSVNNTVAKEDATSENSDESWWSSESKQPLVAGYVSTWKM